MGFSRKGAGLVAVTALSASALTLVPPASGAATTTQSSSAAGASAVTNYGLFGQAFGSRVRGGDLQANSGRTALAFIGCTRETGRTDTNSLVTANLGIATANGIDSRTRTYRGRNGSVNVKSVNTIADVTFENADGLGVGNDLVLEGVRSTARTWHDANGFHRSGRSSLANISFLGVNYSTTGNLVNIPGVATITLSDRDGSKSRNGATMTVRAAVVDLALSDTKVTLGVASARIQDGFVTGVLGGVG
ncbi:MAG: choice-of-anchor P family protein, partial [Nocardioidaceae bacterium]